MEDNTLWAKMEEGMRNLQMSQVELKETNERHGKLLIKILQRLEEMSASRIQNRRGEREFRTCDLRHPKLTLVGKTSPTRCFSRNRGRCSSPFFSAALDRSSMRFILLEEASYDWILHESEYAERFSVISSHHVKLLSKFEDLEPDEHSLVFGNFQPHFEVKMDVYTAMYNVKRGMEDYLPVPVGQTQMPKLYFLFLLVYTCFFIIWVYICIKQRLTILKIHVMMEGLLLFKVQKLICASEDQSYTKISSDSLHYKRRFLGGIAKGVDDEAPTSMWHHNDRLEKVDKSPIGPQNDDPTHHQAHVAYHGQINLVKAYGDPAHQVCAKIIKPGSHFHTPDKSAFYKCTSSTSTKGDIFSSSISSALPDDDEHRERNPPSLSLQEDMWKYPGYLDSRFLLIRLKLQYSSKSFHSQFLTFSQKMNFVAFGCLKDFPNLFEKAKAMLTETKANLQLEPLYICPFSEWYVRLGP